MKKTMMSGFLQKWKMSKKFFNLSTAFKEAFHLLTITLLSLLLPLSFLLLARLFCNSYFNIATAAAAATTAAATSIVPYPVSFILSLFFDTNPTLLLGLISTFSVSTLVHGLTAAPAAGGRPATAGGGPCLYASWVCLCFFQIFVCLGIEGSIAAGVQGGSSPLGSEDSNLRFLSSTKLMMCFGVGCSALGAAPVTCAWQVFPFAGGVCSYYFRFYEVVFFLGLHETMRHWARVVVKPVVDDSVLGGPREERWPEKVVTAVGFGILWWWRLREEVEALVVVPKVKMELLMGLGVADFIGWWLYYLTITIGVVKVVKSLVTICMIMMCRGSRRQQSRLFEDLDGHGVEDKV